MLLVFFLGDIGHVVVVVVLLEDAEHVVVVMWNADCA